MANNDSKRFWSAKEAADYLCVSRQTLYQWLGEDSKLWGPPIPHRRFGQKCLRFPIEEFIAWADSKEKQNV